MRFTTSMPFVLLWIPSLSAILHSALFMSSLSLFPAVSRTIFLLPSPTFTVRSIQPLLVIVVFPLRCRSVQGRCMRRLNTVSLPIGNIRAAVRLRQILMRSFAGLPSFLSRMRTHATPMNLFIPSKPTSSMTRRSSLLPRAMLSPCLSALPLLTLLTLFTLRLVTR